MELEYGRQALYCSPSSSILNHSDSLENNGDTKTMQELLLSPFHKDCDVLRSWCNSSTAHNSEDGCLDWQSLPNSESLNDLPEMIMSDHHRLNSETQFLMQLLDNDAEDISNSFAEDLSYISKSSEDDLSTAELEFGAQNASHQNLENHENSARCTEISSPENACAVVPSYNPVNSHSEVYPLSCRYENQYGGNSNKPQQLQAQQLPQQLQQQQQQQLQQQQQVFHYVGIVAQSPVIYQQQFSSSGSQPRLDMECATRPYRIPGDLQQKNVMRAERQKKRREKNRECSRLFRMKQRVKEDSLKRGKYDKEVTLSKLRQERDKLLRTLHELCRSKAPCSKALEMLTEFKTAKSHKENRPNDEKALEARD